MAGVSVQGKGMGAKKIAILFAVMAAVCLGAFALYIHYAQSGAGTTTPPSNIVVGKPSVSAALLSQDILSYSNSSSLLPYALFSYSASNASTVAVNFTVFKSRLPNGGIFVLNTSDECFNCGSTAGILSSLAGSLVRYGLIRDPSGISIAQVSSATALPNDSIVIILNGLLPAQLLTPNSRNVTPIAEMMNKGISVIYVGQDFSHALLPGSIVIPTSNITFPTFLADHDCAAQLHPRILLQPEHLRIPARQQARQHNLPERLQRIHRRILQRPDSWPSYADVGADIATAIQALFWLPRYSIGYASIKTPGLQSSGRIGVIGSGINTTRQNVLSGRMTTLNGGYARAVISANTAAGTNTVYQYLYFSPSLSLNGTVSVAPSIASEPAGPGRHDHIHAFDHAAADTAAPQRLHSWT